MIGTRIGKIVVAEMVGRAPRSGQAQWRCVCDCGKEVIRIQGNLRESIKHRVNASCGCQLGEPTHRETGTRLHRIWSGMKTRCTNPNRDKWEQYGGRGIRFCDEWKSYEAFRDWALANNYADNLTLDRKDNDGNYTPDNCRWAPAVIQARNKSTSRKVTLNGVTLTVTEWALRLGINVSTLQYRYTEGWPPERMLAK